MSGCAQHCMARAMPPVCCCLGVLVLGLALALGVGPTDAARAQRTPGSFGIGLHVGRPGGVLAKWYRTPTRAYAATFTTDLDDRALLALHGMHERRLSDASSLHGFVGPGLSFGIAPHNGTAQAAAGVRVLAGLNFYAERFEVVMRAVPRLRVVPTWEPQLGGSVGLRYYFF